MKNKTTNIFFLLSFFCIQFVHANSFVMKNDTTINQLTQNEKSNGWQLLFDGNSLNGWKTFKNKPGSWKTENGVLCSYTADSGNSDLLTQNTYENFELSIDWKISAGGNSGIMYLVTEDYDEAYLSGPEYQLIDDNGFQQKLEEWQRTGANYAMHAPALNAAKKPGEWNTTRIIVNKGHVEHWLNDKKVVEYDLWSDEWKAQKNAGKWKDAPGYCASKSGHIALQSSHSNVETSGICFRNIKIKEL
jgi:hypothetical protein